MVKKKTSSDSRWYFLGTLVALCYLLEYDLSQDLYQYALLEVNGIEVLVNILETNDSECKLAALQLLLVLSKQNIMKRCLINLGAVLTLIMKINEPDIRIKILASRTLANILRLRKARRILRTHDGIAKVIHIDVPEKYLITPVEQFKKKHDKQRLDLALSILKVWWNLGNLIQSTAPIFLYNNLATHCNYIL